MTRAGRKTDAATMLLMVLLILTAAKLLLERLLALMLPHDLHQNTRLLLSMAQEALLIGLPALLMRRGLSPEGGETPEPEETPETGDGQEELLALIRKKYAKNMADRAGMEKTIAALYRRGYPLEEIKAAMNTILEQEENCRDD